LYTVLAMLVAASFGESLGAWVSSSPWSTFEGTADAASAALLEAEGAPALPVPALDLHARASTPQAAAMKTRRKARRDAITAGF
jgi:hypothetical protein